MALIVDFFFTPGLVTWDSDCPLNPEPIASVVLSENPDSSRTLLVGRNARAMSDLPAFRRRDRVLLAVPDLPRVSKTAVAISWVPKMGLEVTLLSENHGLEYRLLGQETPEALRPGDDSTRTVRASHLAVAIGRDGLWFATRPSTADYWVAGQPSMFDVEGDATPLPENFADLFFCPASIHDVRHVLDEDDCANAQHRAARKRLITLTAMHLPSLDWPPGGWYLPKETWKGRAAMYGGDSNPTKLAESLSRDVNERTLHTVADSGIIPMLLFYGWLQPGFLLEAAEHLKTTTGPVDWTVRPSGMLGVVAANSRPPKSVTVYDCPPSSRQTQRRHP